MPSRSRVTMSDVAEKSGVSLSTVSLVLRDKPGVGDDTRERVQQVARDLGYIPGRPTGPTGLVGADIGLLLKSEPAYAPRANPFYAHVLAGIEDACRTRQANLLYATMPVDRDSYPLELPRMLVEDSVDGLLLVGAFLDETLAQVVERSSTPIVLVDAYASSERYDAVVSDNQAGGYRSAWFLIRQGHRHIGVVGCHPRAYPSIRQRQHGYLRALADAGLSTAFLAECHIADAEEVRRATARLLADHPEITAILAANDETAIAALDAARGLGRHVPGDLSLVGFDNIDLAARIAPPLTTMHVDKVGMGRMAVQLLANRLAHPEASPVTASIRPTWIERDSVRAIDGGPRASAPEEESPS